MDTIPTQLPLDLLPVEAEAVDELPTGPGWQFEPKYDGFRCLAHRRGSRVHLQSKNQKPLERYFPEVTQGLEEIVEADFVLDGELVTVGGSFESLQLRLHPAESRVSKLARETPAQLIVFDLLARAGISLLERPLAERRRELEDFMARGCLAGAQAWRSDRAGRRGTRLARTRGARWHRGQATRSSLSARRTSDAQVQALEDDRLRCRRDSTTSVARRPWSICCLGSTTRGSS